MSELVPANNQPKVGGPLTIQCPMLSNTNYTVWAMRMEATLRVHKVWETINPGSDDEGKNDLTRALLFQSIPEALILQVGKQVNAKGVWDAIKSRNLGAERVREARLQTLMAEFDRLKMKESDTIDEFVGKISEISTKSTSLGEEIEESKIVKKFLKSLPRRKYIHIIASLEQVLDLKTTSFEDIVGRLKTYEERVYDEEDLQEDQSKLMYVNTYSQQSQEGGRGRGPGRGRGRGRGRFGYQQRDKSEITCYRCDKQGHYASECPDRLLKLIKAQESQENVEEDTREAESLMMHEVVYLNEKNVQPKVFETSSDKAWYLDNGASNHMTGNQAWFCKIDESITGKVRFGDDSCIDIKGKGSILFITKGGEKKILADVYYIPELKSNILSLGQATEAGCDVRMKEDYLTLHDRDGNLLVKANRSKNRLYKVNMEVETKNRDEVETGDCGVVGTTASCDIVCRSTPASCVVRHSASCDVDATSDKGREGDTTIEDGESTCSQSSSTTVACWCGSDGEDLVFKQRRKRFDESERERDEAAKEKENLSKELENVNKGKDEFIKQQDENSPFLDKLKKRSYEVLYMVDAIDEYVVGQLKEDEKPVVRNNSGQVVSDKDTDECSGSVVDGAHDGDSSGKSSCNSGSEEEKDILVHQSSDVVKGETTGVQAINKDKMDDLPVVVADAMGQTEKEENSSGDLGDNLVQVACETSVAVNNQGSDSKVKTGGAAGETEPADAVCCKPVNFDDLNSATDMEKGLKLEDETEEEKKKKEEKKNSFQKLCKMIKKILGDKVEKVVVFDRIVDFLFCLVTDEYGWTANMERIMKAQALRDSSMSGYVSSKKTMEINPDNGIMEELRKGAEADKNEKSVKDLVMLLFETALLTSGFNLDEPNTFAARFMTETAAGGDVEQDFTTQLSVLKEELEETRQVIRESEKNLKCVENEQKAHILTKTLGRINFKEMRDLIGVHGEDFKLKGENVG